MDILFILFICAIAVYYNLTTKDDRRRWWWNSIAALIVVGILGAGYTTLKTGSIPAPTGDYSR